MVTQQRGVTISFEETWKRKTSTISTPKYEMAVCFFMRFKKIVIIFREFLKIQFIYFYMTTDFSKVRWQLSWHTLLH